MPFLANLIRKYSQMISLERAYGDDAARVREIYARIESGDIAFLRKEFAAFPYALEPPGFIVAGYPGVLHYAAEHNQLAVCQLLVELGVDVNQVTAGSGNSTPLGLAARNGQLEVVKWLLEVGADVDGSPESVTSPLIAAVTFGNYDVVDLLLSHHADINRLHAKFNRTALDLAQSWGFDAIAKRLEAEGGISAITRDPDEDLSPGAPIVEFVTRTVGWVLPEKLTPQVRESNVRLRVGCIADKNDFKLFFTVGLFEQRPRTELFICLPGSWRLPRQGLNIDSAWAFPQGLLAGLSRRIIYSDPLTEDEIILRSDPAYSSLSWPKDTDALILVDKVWAAADNFTVGGHYDSVKLYVLAPLKLTKKGPPRDEALEKILQKKRTTSWKSVALPSPL